MSTVATENQTGQSGGPAVSQRHTLSPYKSLGQNAKFCRRGTCQYYEWLIRGFQIHADFQNLQLLGEAPGVDEKATEECPEGGQKLTDGKDYAWDQIFNFDKGGLYHKHMLPRAYISKTEKQAPGFQAGKLG